MPKENNCFHHSSSRRRVGQITLKVLVALGVIFLDQATKELSASGAEIILNHGGVWGIFPGNGWLMVVGVILIGMLGWWLKQEGRWGILGSLMWAAGVANYLDRWRLGGVRDFIYYPYLEIYGNVADLILLLGMAWGLIEWRHESDRAKNLVSGIGSGGNKQAGRLGG